jgi:hypothetical protein
MTAAELLRDIVEALPKTEFWTPKLHAAEKKARWFILQTDALMDARVAQVHAKDAELDAMAERAGVLGKPKVRKVKR